MTKPHDLFIARAWSDLRRWYLDNGFMDAAVNIDNLKRETDRPDILLDICCDLRCRWWEETT